MALRTPDPTGSDTGPVSFELDGFELDGDRCLELRGRWFGIRGRRFVRPTLVMRIDGERHRLLADLDHKPWAAEEGGRWVASFSPAPPAGRVEEIELSVAPDVTISLTTPGSRALSPTMKRPAESGTAPARPASPRQGEAVRRPRPPDVGRAKAEDLGHQLEAAAIDNARLTAERNALSAERDALTAERKALTAERHRLAAERDRLRERVAELEIERKRSLTRAKVGRSEAEETLEAERAETNRLRGLLEVRRTIVADRDRLAHELATAIAERDQWAARANDPPAVAPERRALALPRRGRRPHSGYRAEPAWPLRALAVTAMGAVVLAFALVLHLV